MPLINTSLPNLIQGVSQQPDALRYDGQCEEQENALSSVVDGLVKRPNTRHVAELLSTAIDADSFVHFINRSETEKYVVIHDGTSIRIFNTLDGSEASINGVTGGYTPASTSYLDTPTPREVMKALTVADNTFLLNTGVGVGLKKDGNDVATTPAIEKKALVFIKQGDYSKEYSVTLTGGIGGGSGASITLGLTSYIYSNVQGGYTTYRHRVNSVTVNNGGSDYSSNIQTTVSSNLSLYQQPEINYNVVGGVIQPSGHTIVNGGDFEGSGTNIFDNTRGFNAPTIGSTVTDLTPSVGASGVSTASITSEDETQPEHADTDRILERLVSNANESNDLTDVFTSDYYIKKNANTNLVELVKKDDTTDFAITANDGLAGTGLGVVYKEVNSISDLPTVAPDGFTVKVKGDVELVQDDYYVRFEVTNGHETTSDSITSTVGEGSWVETVAPEVTQGVDASTMPHTLQNDGVNSFQLTETIFTDRVSGDDTTNPLPSFVSQPISNLFFFKSRLGLLSNDNIILSESGLGSTNASGNISYNFSRNTVTTLLDGDPIDISVASSRVTNLRTAKAFQENLIVFSENGQFVLKGGEVLTPKTVSVTPITNFESSKNVEPLPLGSYIYFPFNRGSFTGLREFSVNSTTSNYDSAEVTDHVPSYIPNNITAMTGSTTESIIAMVSASEPSTIYVYKYFWSGNQKVLSAWSKFTLDGDIRGINFAESSLYIVLAYNGATQLVEMRLQSSLKDAAGYITHLDLRVEDTVLNGGNTITLPYAPEDDTVEVYTKDGLQLAATNVGATVTLTQSVVEDTDVWVGLPYTMRYTFSEQLFKASSGNSRSPSASAKLMIRNGALFFNDTAYFQVTVTPKARDSYVNTFTPDVVGSTTLGELNLDSGFYRFPVFTKAEDTTITIQNDSALPSNFTSAEFESFTHSRSNRYG